MRNSCERGGLKLAAIFIRRARSWERLISHLLIQRPMDDLAWTFFGRMSASINSLLLSK